MADGRGEIRVKFFSEGMKEAVVILRAE